MKTIPRFFRLFFVLFLLLMIVLPVAAFQNEEIRLNVKRTFGFSSGAQIRGTFALDIIGNVNITSVTYWIDGQKMAEVTQPPFNLTFQTTNYSIGWHDLSATVITTDNNALQTAVRRFEFASSEAETQAVTGIIIPLLGVMGVIIIIGVITQVVGFQKKGLDKLPYGTERTFGWMGGSICPKCQRAFSIHWWGLNAVIGKYDRCDFCGKWSIVRRKSDAELQAAIKAELSMAEPEIPIPSKSSSEKEKETIDGSKYVDL